MLAHVRHVSKRKISDVRIGRTADKVTYTLANQQSGTQVAFHAGGVGDTYLTLTPVVGFTITAPIPISMSGDIPATIRLDRSDRSSRDRRSLRTGTDRERQHWSNLPVR